MAESETKTSGQSPETDKKVDMRSKIKQEPDTPGKIMVSGIPKNENYADADLEKEFAPFGRITEVNIIRDRRSNLPRGFAFITYENPQDAEDAIKALEGKNLGGETPIHCEQAVIGLRRSKQLTDEVRGGGRGRGGRGGDRGGRGGDRGRGRGGERGARGRSTMERGGRGRGFMERGGRGMRGRPHPDRYAEMGGGHQDNYYEEYYEPEPAYDSYPRGGPASRRGLPRRGGLLGREGPPEKGLIMGRGGPPGRGIVPGRSRGLAGMEPSSRGGPPRRALLPHPSARGSRGGYGGPLRRDEYYDDEANGYQEEYYETQGNGPYAEEYEEQYPEAEDYYTRDRPEPPRNRGGIAPRGRGRLQPPDEYGYSYEEDVHSRLQAPAQRRNMAAGYLEEEYEESVPQIAVDPYERPRIRAPSNGAPPVRGARGGAIPSRRGGLLGNDPYSDESGRYDSVSGPTAGPPPGYEVESYGDSFGRRPAAPGANRMRPTPPADVYTTERIKPKPQPLMAEMVGQRRGMMGAPGHYLDNYQSANAAPTQGRDAFPEARRPPVRRDPYSRVAAETDDYVSYPPTSQGSAELSRKRHIDPFEEELPRGGRREFEEYRSAPIAPPIPLKRDRLDRNVYEAYSSRQEGAYRGL